MNSGQKVGKVSLQQIAERASVGIATVDRVLNERGNVSVETTKKVLDAAREMHIKRVLPDSYYKVVRIEAIIPRPELPLCERMNREFKNLAGNLDRSVIIHRTILKDDSPDVLSKAIRKTTCNGTIVFAQEHPLIHEAISENAEKDIPAVTILTDLPHSKRLAYAGADPYVAGRTAGYFLALMRPPGSKFIILCSHFAVHGHVSRIAGFSDYLKKLDRGFEIAEIVEGMDDANISEINLRAALKRHPDIAAIYNVGAANRAVVAAIDAANFRQRPLFVGHELTPFTRQVLRSGQMTLTIDQNPEMQARHAVELLLRHFGFAGAAHSSTPLKSGVPFTLYSPENIID